jgi:hypothetical protein
MNMPSKSPDAANAIATVVSTKVLTPRQAVIMAAVANFIGALGGTAVASYQQLVEGKRHQVHVQREFRPCGWNCWAAPDNRGQIRIGL